MGKRVDLTGQKFGRLTVIERLERNDGHTSWWKCLCDCGNTKEVRGTCLKKGETRSCGCLNSELSRERGKKLLTKHGWYGTRLYNIWHNMRDRCYRKDSTSYPRYGGRGIRICKEWLEHPEAFCEWAVNNGYSETLWIDRIDNDGDYSPDNCRWITKEEQQTNKCNNVNITYNGKTQCIAQWAKELNIHANIMYKRKKMGWTNPQEILFGRKKGVMLNG